MVGMWRIPILLGHVVFHHGCGVWLLWLVVGNAICLLHPFLHAFIFRPVGILIPQLPVPIFQYLYQIHDHDLSHQFHGSILDPYQGVSQFVHGPAIPDIRYLYWWWPWMIRILLCNHDPHHDLTVVILLLLLLRRQCRRGGGFGGWWWCHLNLPNGPYGIVGMCGIPNARPSRSMFVVIIVVIVHPQRCKVVAVDRLEYRCFIDACGGQIFVGWWKNRMMIRIIIISSSIIIVGSRSSSSISVMRRHG